MEKFLSDHSLKIKLGVAIIILMSVVGFVFRATTVVNQVEANVSDIVEVKAQTQAIPIIRNDIGYIKEDVQEIKSILLNGR